MTLERKEAKEDKSTTKIKALTLEARKQLFIKAIKAEDLETIDVLLASGIDANTDLVGIQTALKLSTKNQTPLVFNHLLAITEKVKDENPNYNLTYSILLLNCPWSTDEKLNALVSLVAKRGNLLPRDYDDIIEKLKSKDYIAASLGDIERLKKSKTIAETKDMTLHSAAANGQIEVMEWLLKNGANPKEHNAWGMSAFHVAADNGQLEAVKLLHGKGFKIDEGCTRSRTALILAASNGHLETVKWLLENGANINDPRALIWAAANDQQDIVKYLLSKGAKLNQTNSDGMTALLYAVQNGHEELVTILIRDYGADPNIEIPHGKTIKAMVLHNQKVSKDSILRNPAALDALYLEYFTKQQDQMTQAVVGNLLDDSLSISDLRKLIFEYANLDPSPDAPEDKESKAYKAYTEHNEFLKSLPDRMKKEADTLIKPLQNFCTLKHNLIYNHRDLATQLLNEIELQNPCNARTINRATTAFLETHGNKINNSKLGKILNQIIEKTKHFNKPSKPSSAAQQHASPLETKRICRELNTFIEKHPVETLAQLDKTQLDVLSKVIIELEQGIQKFIFDTQDMDVLSKPLDKIAGIKNQIRSLLIQSSTTGTGQTTVDTPSSFFSPSAPHFRSTETTPLLRQPDEEEEEESELGRGRSTSQ